MQEKTITEFLDQDYREFANYVVESRAIPSVIDGFKPTQRKIIHISNTAFKTGTEKAMKIFQLSGRIAADAFYHHGSKSLEDAIITMAQRFKNNAPLLIEDGQFGSLRSPEPGAARYIGTKLSPNFRLLYKDFDLLEYKEEEGYKIEPKYFLPIIPTVLLNGSSGIAVGFATNILNRDPIELIDAVVKVLGDKKIKTIKPHLNNYKGEFVQDKEIPKRWIIRGVYEKQNTNTVRVTELPPSVTYEKYENHLDDLIEKNIIVSYEDNSRDNVDYTIKFTREALSDMDETKLKKILKLEESETENFTTLDEYGKLKIFECMEDIIYYFTNFRLTYYQKRKDFLVKKLIQELLVMSNRAKFIKAILDLKLKVNNRKKEDIINDIEKMKLDKVDGNYDYLLRMPIYSLTKELFDKLLSEQVEKKVEIETTKKMATKDMYLNDLSELKKSIKKL
jgi:DNA topoisomerase-2